MQRERGRHPHDRPQRKGGGRGGREGPNPPPRRVGYRMRGEGMLPAAPMPMAGKQPPRVFCIASAHCRPAPCAIIFAYRTSNDRDVISPDVLERFPAGSSRACTHRTRGKHVASSRPSLRGSAPPIRHPVQKFRMPAFGMAGASGSVHSPDGAVRRIACMHGAWFWAQRVQTGKHAGAGASAAAPGLLLYACATPRAWASKNTPPPGLPPCSAC